jgi:hypothetical protein
MSGFIVKLDRVTTGGPRSCATRSTSAVLVSAMGASLVAGNLACLALFLLFFGRVYPPTVFAEEASRGEVRHLMPAPTRPRAAIFVPDPAPPAPSGARFDMQTFRRNRSRSALVWIAVLALLYRMSARRRSA